MEDKSFRHSASFGKRIEHYLIGKMLKEGLDVYIPMVDDDAVDVVVKRPDKKYVEVQIKARSKDVNFGDAALFSAIPHQPRENYWFVFYSERLDKMWILSSTEFIHEAYVNKKGKNIGKYVIWFNGFSKKNHTEHAKKQFDKYLAENFNRIKDEDPDITCL